VKILWNMVYCLWFLFMRCLFYTVFYPGFKSPFHCFGASFAFLLGNLHYHEACWFYGLAWTNYFAAWWMWKNFLLVYKNKL